MMECRAGSGEGDSDCGGSDRGDSDREESECDRDCEGESTPEELLEGVDGGTGELGTWARLVGGAANSRSGLGDEAKIGFGQEWL